MIYFVVTACAARVYYGMYVYMNVKICSAYMPPCLLKIQIFEISFFLFTLVPSTLPQVIQESIFNFFLVLHVFLTRSLPLLCCVLFVVCFLLLFVLYFSCFCFVSSSSHCQTQK